MRGGGSAGWHFGSVDETTQRLVGRCERVPWLGVDGLKNAGEKKCLLLGAEMADAMTSALSVVAVTTQREKPGVQTPSRMFGGQEVGDSLGVGVTSEDGMTGRPRREGKSPFEVEGGA